MVARTHIAPSSKWGMNSPPMKGIKRRDAPKMTVARIIVRLGRSRHQRSSEAYSSFNHSYARFAFSFTPCLNQYEARTGTRVRVKSREPSSAHDMVSAIG